MTTASLVLRFVCALVLLEVPLRAQTGRSPATFSGANAVAAKSATEKDIAYRFATGEYLIQMNVAFFEPYLGRRLIFFGSGDPRKELCYSGEYGTTSKCASRFVGAVAVVRYSAKAVNRAATRAITIREYVRVLAQSPDLPARAPFSMTQTLVNGIGSDIQAFGYDEASLKPADREQTREQAQVRLWRFCRQELYVDQESRPFAIVVWRYTLNRLSIIQIFSPRD